MKIIRTEINNIKPGDIQVHKHEVSITLEVGREQLKIMRQVKLIFVGLHPNLVS